MTLKSLRLQLLLPIFIVSSLLVIWHYDFDRLGSVPFGTRSAAYSLFFDQTFAIDNYKDNAGVDFAFYNGHYYSGYPPLVPVVTAAFLGAEQVVVYLYTHLVGPVNGHIAWWLESWFIALPQILSLCGLAWLLFSLLQHLGKSYRLSYFVSWLLVFTSYALVYSVGANNDLPAAFLVFLGFYLLVTGQQPLKFRRLFFAGLVTALAGLAEYPAVLYLLPFCLLIRRGDKGDRDFRGYFLRLIAYFSGAVLPMLGLAIYHTILFGAPWRFAHFFHATKVAPGQTAANKVDFSLLNIPTGLRGLLISPLKGLFIYAPPTLFSFIGLKRFYLQRRDVLLSAVFGVALIILFYAVWWDWSGGFDFASRYLISTLPFFYLGLAFALPVIFKRVWSKLAFLLVVIWSFLTTIIFTFTGIREAIRMENWTQWGALGRFESFFKVFTDNNPRDVAPFIIRFGSDFPGLSCFEPFTRSLMLLILVVAVASIPLFLTFRPTTK